MRAVVEVTIDRLGATEMFIPIQRKSPLPLSLQVFLHIREMIHSGALKGGDRVPSSRALARELGISRNVVMIAYDQLLAEGYVETKHGSGTRIAQGIGRLLAEETRLMSKRSQAAVPGRSTTENAPRPRTARQSRRLYESVISFRSGIPDVEGFPLKIWGKILRDTCFSAQAVTMSYDAPEGTIELRSAIAHYLYRTRGLRCDPDQIIIVSGATQGLSLAAKLLYTKGATAIVEDPLNTGMRRVISSAGYSLHPLPVDEHGLTTSLLCTSGAANLIYVTPSHQFPLGGVLPAPRRSELIAHASDTGAYIVEDDYDSEFRHEGPPLSALQSMAPERVIYVGSFSKILAPALRMGYLILPFKLVSRARILKLLSDVHTPTIDQLALARFIDEGRLERHVAKAKRLYATRRRAVLSALASHFSDKCSVEGAAAGLHLVAKFSEWEFTEDLVSRIAQNGVRVVPVESHAVGRGLHRHRLILGYGHLTPEQISEGIRRLSIALQPTSHGVPVKLARSEKECYKQEQE